ncbi:MAG: AAA-like domain-containing protein [Nostocales cyanobacterium 94392]|nr:AAA-like domain-containing protein [Nostocales cyanobacterium 94392]
MVDNYEYQVGASLPPDAPSYVVRKADSDFYHALKAGKYCYVFNSRQMGKSSLKVRVMQRLVNEGVACSSIDISGQGSKDNVTQEQWYTGIVSKIVKDLQIAKPIEFRRTWWRDRNDISPVQKLDEFIEDVLLTSIPGQIIIFVDEIDSTLSLKFASEDFFALIRSCYNKRAENLAYKRLTFALLGVATPGDLIQDKTRTPFNIGEAIELDGFKINDIEPLAKGLAGKVENPQAVMQEVLAWTGGQPFLTQRVCELLGKNLSIEKPDFTSVDDNQIIEFVKEVINNQIIDNWEANDKQEHLKTIRDRLLINEEVSVALLGLYQQILQQEEMTADSGFEQMRLRLTGLVVQQQGKLKVYNQIYGNVFDINWVENELSKLRFYADKLRAWVESNYQDNTCFLRGKDLEKARVWADRRRLSDVDYRFLSASLEAELNQKVVNAETRTNKALEEERKAKQRTRIGVFVLGVFVLGAVVASVIAGKAIREQGFAISQRNKANLQRDEAKKELKSVTDQKLEAEAALTTAQANEKNAHRKVEAANRNYQKATEDVKQKQREVAEKDQQLKIAVEKEKSAKTSANKAQLDKQQANQQAELAKQKRQRAEMERQVAVNGLTVAKQKLENIRNKQFQALKDLKYAQDTTRLEQQGTTAIRQFELQQIEALLLAMDAGRKLKQMLNDGKQIEDYPTVTPILALQTILDNIREVNKFNSTPSGIGVTKFSPDGQLAVTTLYNGTAKLWDITGKLIADLKGHINNVTTTSENFSSNGQYIILISDDNTAKVWNIAGTLIANLRGHQKTLTSAGFSPNSQLIVTTSEDSTAKLWDITGKLITDLKGHKKGLTSASFSPNGQLIVTASEDGTAKIWDITGKLITDLKGHKMGLTSVSFSPNGQLIVTASEDGRVKIWNSVGQLKTDFKAHSDGIYITRFSQDGQSIITVSAWGDDLILWDISGKQLIRFAHSGFVWDADFSRDGRYILTALSDGKVTLQNIKVNVPIELEGNSGNFSRDGQYIVTKLGNGGAKVWNITGKYISEIKDNQIKFGNASFSPDGKSIIISSEYTTAYKIWDSGGKLIFGFEEDWGKLKIVEFSLDGKYIISILKDGIARVRNASGKLIFDIKGHRGKITGASFSSDGKYIITGSEDGMTKVWNTKGSQILNLKGHHHKVESAYFSKDGKRIITSDQSIINVWNIEGKLLFKIPKDDNDSFTHANFSPDGKFIISASWNNLKVWNKNGRQLFTLKNSYDVSFSPCGKYIFYISGGVAKLLHLHSGLTVEFKGHGDRASKIVFSPDGKRIVTTSRDGATKIWDINGRLIADLKGHETEVNSVNFSPSGRHLITASYDGKVKVWKVEELDDLLVRGCNWLKDYLATRDELRRKICPGK